MIKIIFLTILIFSTNIYACNFTSLLIDVPSEALGLGEAYQNCSIWPTEKRACKCVNKNNLKFDPPAKKLDQLSDFRKKKYIEQAYLKAQKSLLSLSQDIVSLSNHQDFADDVELGRSCEITNLSKIKCNNNIFGKEKVDHILIKLQTQFSNEVQSNVYATNSKQLVYEGLIPKGSRENRFNAPNSCPISDKSINRINYEKSKLDLAVILKLVNDSNINSREIKTLEQLLQTLRQEKADDINFTDSLDKLTFNLRTDPNLLTLMQLETAFSKLRENNFSSKSLFHLLENNDNIASTKKKIASRCQSTYQGIKKMFCQTPDNVLPSSYNDLQTTLTNNLNPDDLIEQSLANQEIEYFCKNKKDSYPMDQISIDLEEDIPDYIKDATNFNDAIQDSFVLNIKPKADFLCNAMKKDGPIGIKKKIKELGCDKDNISQDCTYLQTAEVLYGDKIEIPGMTIEKLFAEDKKSSVIVDAFLGKEQAVEKTNPTASEKLAESKQSGSKSLRTGQINSSQNKTATSKTEQKRNQEIDRNMSALYDRVASQLHSGQEVAAREKSRWMPTTNKASSPVSSKMKQALSGSINDYDLSANNTFTSAPKSYENTHRDNFYDNNHGEQYTEQSDEERIAEERNRALGQAGEAKAAAAAAKAAAKAGRSPASIAAAAARAGGISIEMLKSVDAKNPTIEISNAENLDELLDIIGSGKFPNKDKLLKLLESKGKKEIFYIKHKSKSNFIVKVIMDKSGNLKVYPHRRSPRTKAYKAFFRALKKRVKKDYSHASKWVEVLKNGKPKPYDSYDSYVKSYGEYMDAQ